MCEIMAVLKRPNGYYGTGVRTFLRTFLLAQRLGRLDTSLTYHRAWEAGLEGTRGSPSATLTFLYENHCESTGYYPISQPLRSLESNQPGRVKAANFALNRTKMTTVGVDWPDAPLSRSEFEP